MLMREHPIHFFNFISGQTGISIPCYYVNIKPMLARKTIFNFISGQTGTPTPRYYVNIKPMLTREILHPLFQFHLRSKPDHRYYVNTKPMLADPSSLESLQWLEGSCWEQT